MLRPMMKASAVTMSAITSAFSSGVSIIQRCN
jgi:hypothetical protein